MMRRASTALFRLFFFFVSGIITANLEVLPLKVIAVSSLPAVFLLFVFWLKARRQLFQQSYFGIIACGCFFLLGNGLYLLNQPLHQKNHYLHYVSNDESYFFQLKIHSVLRSNLYYDKYLAEVIGVNQVSVSGKILVNVARDSTNIPLKTDEILLIKTRLLPINAAQNPHAFDYAEYMRKAGVYGQLRIENQALPARVAGTKTLRGRAHCVYLFLNQKLKENHFSKDHIAIINALILGQKTELSSEVYQNYAAAGVVHILSVSGLHVGILMLLFQYILKPMEWMLKNGRKLKMIVVVLLLWGFAFLAGLSPPVLRAVTMFSFLAVGMHLNRNTSSLHNLVASAFVLLLISPQLLFNMGFQLSYLAVLGILIYYPLFYRLYRPKTFISKIVWSNMLVSTSAQIGVLPLTLFYFHQFPGLYLPANLVVIPFTGTLLGVGILVLVLAAVNLLPYGLAVAYRFVINTLDFLVSLIARQDYFLLENIPFSLTQLLFGYLIIIGSAYALSRRTYSGLVLLLLAIIGYQTVSFFEKITHEKNSQLVVFHISRNTVLGIKSGAALRMYSTLEVEELKDRSFFNDYLTHERIRKVEFSEKMPVAFSFNCQKIRIVDSTAQWFPSEEADIVILTQSPAIHLTQLINSMQPEKIIADGSNYASYVKRWKATSLQEQCFFHHTTTDGAFILNAP